MQRPQRMSRPSGAKLQDERTQDLLGRKVGKLEAGSGEVEEPYNTKCRLAPARRITPGEKIRLWGCTRHSLYCIFDWLGPHVSGNLNYLKLRQNHFLSYPILLTLTALPYDHPWEAVHSESMSSPVVPVAPAEGVPLPVQGTPPTTFDIARCSRCQRSLSLAGQTGSGVVQFGMNSYYCIRCATKVGFVR